MNAPLGTLRYSKLIDDAAHKSREPLKLLRLGHHEAYQELAAVWEECRKPGWDGYDAIEVSQDALRLAYLLIESLPLGFLRPSISAEPDGQIAFEWRTSRRRLISVSVDPAGFLHYAAVLGTERRNGTMEFYSEVPAELLRLVLEL